MCKDTRDYKNNYIQGQKCLSFIVCCHVLLAQLRQQYFVRWKSNLVFTEEGNDRMEGIILSALSTELTEVCKCKLPIGN